MILGLGGGGKVFPARLEWLREKKGHTQKELAQRIGIARTTYSGYANGAREPDLDTLNKIADYFEVSTDYLLGRTDDPRMYHKDYIALREKIDLTDEEIIRQLNLTYDGIELTHSEKIEFLAIARGIFDARKSLRGTT
jgi:transcriptional regulator with XRE-family HTH domain